MWQTLLYYAALMFEAVLGVIGIRLYEAPAYEVVTRIAERIEIRRYAPRVAVQVRLPFAGKASRNEAFRILFAYIAGANSSDLSRNGKIAMTIPVEVSGSKRVAMTVPVQSSETDGQVFMQFFLPAKFTIDRAPKPLDARVKLVERETETIASLCFSGSGHDIAAREAELIDSLSGTGWMPVGKPFALFYDAPFTLPFIRRNEAAVSVVQVQ